MGCAQSCASRKGGECDCGFMSFSRAEMAKQAVTDALVEIGKAALLAAPPDPAHTPLDYIRAEAKRTERLGPVGDFWKEVLAHAEDIAVGVAFTRAVETTKPLRDAELAVESGPIPDLRFKAANAPDPAPGLREALTDSKQLERAVLEIIRLGRDRCGIGFGKYPLGINDALTELVPKVIDTPDIHAALQGFRERMRK